MDSEITNMEDIVIHAQSLASLYSELLIHITSLTMLIKIRKRPGSYNDIFHVHQLLNAVYKKKIGEVVPTT